LFSYEDDSDEGFTNVPGKILCFVKVTHDDGTSDILVVCHPCQWQKKNISGLLREWMLVTCDKRMNNGIPYDIVPFTSLCGHCLMVPDLDSIGIWNEVIDKREWADKFNKVSYEDE